MTNLNFTDFNLEPLVLQAITELGFEEATPIQSKAIPLALEGRDLIGQAQTGTGKTAAFGIPLISKISKSDEKIRALIMAPTRELAIQVAEEIENSLASKVFAPANLRRTRYRASNPCTEKKTTDHHWYTWTSP